MNQAVKPLRGDLTDVETRAEDITRAISDSTNHTHQIDKTMEELREEIHKESRRLQAAGNDLTRRLTQATDDVGLLESTTSDASRRARPDAPKPTSRVRRAPIPMPASMASEVSLCFPRPERMSVRRSGST
jgi:predicted  nucleic acid-binding Zn-ribbon protein